MALSWHDHEVADRRRRERAVKGNKRCLYQLAERQQLGAMLFVDQSREQLATPDQGDRNEEELQAAVVVVEFHDLLIAVRRERRGRGFCWRRSGRTHRLDEKRRVPDGNDFDLAFPHTVDDAIVADQQLPNVLAAEFADDGAGFWEIVKCRSANDGNRQQSKI